MTKKELFEKIESDEWCYKTMIASTPKFLCKIIMKTEEYKMLKNISLMDLEDRISRCFNYINNTKYESQYDIPLVTYLLASIDFYKVIGLSQKLSSSSEDGWLEIVKNRRSELFWLRCVIDDLLGHSEYLNTTHKTYFFDSKQKHPVYMGVD